MTKQGLIKECIRIRDSYSNRTPITDKDKKWLLEEIFKYHPNWDSKGDKIIDKIIVNNNWSHYNTRCFYIVYSDNTYDDISFRWCIQNRPKETID